MTVTVEDRTAAKIRTVTARAEDLRDEIADALALARGPTDAKEVSEHIKARNVPTMEIAFQLDRMAGEGRAVEQGKGRYAHANS
jgi:hypothetical protein